MSAAALIFAIQILSVIGSALTAAKLYRTGLYRRYRFFFWYFLFRIPNSTWPLFFHNFVYTKADWYFIIWVITEPITWIFHTAVVLELYRLVLEKYKGLYTLGRWAMVTGIGISVTISLVSLIPKMTRAVSEQSRWMFRYLAMERGLMLGLAIFLIFMIGFLILYTVPISRNLKIHARNYTIFFISNYLAFLLQSFFGMKVQGGLWFTWTNVLADAIAASCVFAWFFLLNPKGEEVQTSHPIISAQHERLILHQLDALNATLLKASRK